MDKIILTLVFFLFASSAMYAQKKNEIVKSADLKMGSDSTYVHIGNTGNKTGNIFFNINGNFFRNQTEIVSHIKNIPGNEPEHVKAWEFIVGSTFHDDTITCQTWLHNPLIFINSVGYGYCDDRASVLSFLWSAQGYKSQVWNLEGHVIPEVYINGRFEMYDPDYEVYYTDKDKKVMGAEEIMKNLETAFVPSENKVSLRTCVKAYGVVIKELYGSFDNNRLGSYYETQTNLSDFSMTMPAGAELILPLNRNSKMQNNLNLKHTAFLLLPVGYKGILTFPFAIHSVTGQANVRYNSHILNITDNYPFVNLGFDDTLDVTCKKGQVVIEFYVNPMLLFTGENVKTDIWYENKPGMNFDITVQEKPKYKSRTIFWSGIDSVDCKCINERGAGVKQYSVANRETLDTKVSKYLNASTCTAYTEKEVASVTAAINEIDAFADSLGMKSMFYQFINNESSFIYNIEKLRMDRSFISVIKERLIITKEKKLGK